uniref:Peptidase M12A domain-containing protein n=1 Tax=Megaselia scalaris TaxID=36166 RepID=T1GM45_MEGSC
MDDMILTQKQFRSFFTKEGAFAGRSVRGYEYAWPKAIVPILIDDKIGERQRQMIADAINTIASKTCIRIRPATRYDDYAVFITNQHNGCFSEVGFVKKSTQLMNLHPEVAITLQFISMSSCMSLALLMSKVLQIEINM